MNILQVASFFYPHVGGSEVYALELSKQLRQRGHRVRVLTSRLPGTKAHERVEGVEVIRLPGIYLPNVPYFLFSAELLGWLLEHAPQFDILHAHVRFFCCTSAVALLRSLRASSRFVLTLHATQPKPPTPWLAPLVSVYEHSVSRFALRRADALIALDAHVSQHVRRYGADARKVTLIPNGVDTHRFRPVASPVPGSASPVYEFTGLRVDGFKDGFSTRELTNPRTREQERSETTFRVGTIGNLVVRKGVHYLLEAIAQLPATLPVQVTLVGDGPERQRLSALCQQWNLGERVRFLGAVDKDAIPAFLHQLDVLALPSLAEGMPTVLLEAMASGVPVIATDVGAVSTLIHSEEVGIVVPPESPEAIAQALESLWANPSLRLKLAANARRHIEQSYSWEAIASQIEDVYRRVLHAGTHGPHKPSE